jgi:hypothetical protein
MDSTRNWESRAGDSTYVDVDAVVTPTDRVRWAAVLAGLFAVLATLVVLTVLGLAIGLSTYDAQNTNAFNIGAGLWGAISALIAFFLGGMLAGRSSALPGHNSGVLNGAMVWIVAIPLIINILGSGIGTLLGIAGDVATTAANVAGPVAGQVVEEAGPAINEAVDEAADAAAGEAAAGGETAQTDVEAAAEDAVAGAQGAVENLQQQVTPQRIEDVAQDASGAAWGALLALGLSAAAAILGGFLGARTYDYDPTVRRPATTTSTTVR